jgi:autophagy-related protein 11
MAALQVLTIPLGQCIVVSDPIPTSLEDLTAYLATVTGIRQDDQILLNSKGRRVRLQNYLTEVSNQYALSMALREREANALQNVLFLYDRVLFSSSGTALNNVHLAPLPSAYSPQPFPKTLADQKSLKAWQNLFKQRRDWANEVLSQCQALRREADEFLSQRAILESGVRVATTSVETPIKVIEKRLVEIADGVKETSEDVQQKVKSLDGDLVMLGDIPALGSFSTFFIGHGATGKKKSLDGSATLAEFVDRNSAKAAVTEAKTMFSRFNGQIGDFEVALKNLAAQIDELKRGLDVAQSRSMSDEGQEPTKLVGEIEAVAAKVASDCDTIMALRTEPKSLAQASRIALLHTKNFLPGLEEYAKEMSELVLHTVQQRNAAVVRVADLLQMVASIESQQAVLKESVNSLKMTEDDWSVVDRISLPSEIPSIYGSLLTEAVRRNEWINKMRRDSSNLAEEIAGYQEEEQRRRKKWIKTMKDIIPESFDSTTLGMEINLQGGGEDVWPEATRADLDEYIKALQEVQGTSNTVKYLIDLVRDLDKPTRQQVKRAKAFKNGSVHEAGFGKGSMLLRGEDESRVFKEVITKLEEEVRGYKSRVRKLEDLLHRQSQFSRMSTPQNGMLGDTGTTLELPERSPSVSSPRGPEQAARQPSSSSRRFSTNQLNDDKLVARRIVQLEADLVEERRLRANLEKDLSEANSTKRDIMQNMEARQIEFLEERKSLEDEHGKSKQRIEELEDELDRFVGSRDIEKANADRRVDQLVMDLERARQDHANELRTFKEQVHEQSRNHQAESRRRDQIEAEHKDFLTTLLTSLSPGLETPDDMAQLMARVEEVAHRSANAADSIAQELALARSENDNLQSSLAVQRTEVSSLSMKLESREADMSKVKEDLASEKAKASSIAAQLEEERVHLQGLREKFADGETGSEALRRRLTEEESKVTSLSSKLAEAKSHNNSLDVELYSLQSRYRSLQGQLQTSISRLEDRAQRSKEITQRLYTQNNRLFRLLEALGFAVTYDEHGMMIQRASKVGASSVLPDQSIAMSSHTSAAMSQSRRLLEDLSDLSCLLWMEKESSKEEASKFSEFMEKSNRLNLDALCDAISKRMRDLEHTARKYQREARTYRDKSRKYQTESHDKIAYRSFKEGDLALFLPTRNQPVRSWAAFNVGAPHYFIREQDSHRLTNKEWLVARITKVEERIVDLSKNMNSSTRALDGRSIGEASEGGMSAEDDNPFDLSDGLRWYYLDAQEEKPGAPSTPGLGKTTVAAANVDARGSIRMTKSRGRGDEDVSKQLSKSLDSRRSSTGSKKSAQIAATLGINKPIQSEALHEDTNSLSPSPSRAIGAATHLRTSSQTSSLRNALSARDDGQQPPAERPLGTGNNEGNDTIEEVRKDQVLGP